MPTWTTHFGPENFDSGPRAIVGNNIVQGWRETRDGKEESKKGGTS
jgi:hypothetical protein